MKREKLIETLGRLGYSLVTPARPKVSQRQVLRVLEELAGSDEPRLMEGFPLVLATCAHRGIKVDFRKWLSESRPTSGRRRDLEKLLLVAADLLDSENLQRPEGFNDILEPLRSRYGKLLDAEVVALESGVSLSTERLRNTLRRYAADLSSSTSAGQRQRDKQQRSFQVNLHLGTLLSPKQRELVLKRLEGKPLTKTEQEYYSRVVKKKLEALANSDVRRIAVTLLRR